ncbi:MAG: ATP-binding protein [Candidatus Poribacteria bacterium]|nr:ATP-binding protein [Candidatus Poribacteria bacterium]
MKQLFTKLYSAQTEDDVDQVVKTHPNVFKSENWFPLGGHENNFGVIENQQSTPIAALIEKITNSIDAVLMKKCLEVGINPKSSQAPKSMEEARMTFFPNHGKWDMPGFRNQQAESIQILADGPRRNTSLIIYDDGEGQHPEEFENTFLSLLRGNKNEIHFVQGKYNMGGSGAIVFCGKKRYQLIGSKRYDNTGEFGFTLIREHPLSQAEKVTKKNTWYEYLKIDGKIPAFQADRQDLKLFNRDFTTGTIIKLYSYHLSGISDISRDLNLSINEYLFEPVLPVYTIEKEERYPKSSLRRGLYGLKRRLEQEDNKYVEESFSEEFDDALFGKMKVTCYVFRTKIDDSTVKETKETIQREFFKNNMSVLFSVNGQTHGHYTSEFITKSLKLNLLKEHLLIHVDCTNMNYDFRKELFMASRDRLKGGEETRALRRFLAEKLIKDGRLVEIQKRRKDSIAVESEDAKDLLKSFAQNFSRNEELLKLLEQTLNLDLPPKGNQKRNTDNSTKKKQSKKEQQPFNPQRFPALFKRRVQGKKDKEVVTIPFGGEKTIFFDTDVENNYFDRIEEPGELKIAILDFKTNDTEGGDAPGKVDRIDDVFNVGKSSPQNGTIKIHLNPKKEVSVGDEAKIKVSLGAPTGEFEEIFWVKISERKAPPIPAPRPKKKEIPSLGLPDLKFAYKEEKQERNGELTWEQVALATGEEMDHGTVMYPMVNGEKLETVYINMDSTVLKNSKAKTRNANQEQLETADKKYIASVYSHTLFLYSITKAHKYEIVQEENGADSGVELGTYLKDLFDSYYAEFLLNFGFDEIIQLIGD